ncbi:MAG: esterase family protein [Oscillospiraceae bacterium]|nr:esterase family protein [Oscillospiraceae bacterium]
MALIQANFKSEALLRAVTIQVILPVDGYSEYGMPEPKNNDKPYKTLYLLHGIFGNCMDWITKSRIQRWAHEKNIAVVMPSGDNSFYIDQPESRNLYGEFIGQELVDVTRKMFPLSHKREDTYIGGLSMGGFGAVLNGLKYHKTFGYIAGLSSALHILDDMENIKNSPMAYILSCFGNLEEAVLSDKNPRVLVKKLKEEGAEFPKIFLACGTEDALIDSNRAYRDFFLENGVDLTYCEGPGRHDWDFWDLYIQKVLEWLPL